MDNGKRALALSMTAMMMLVCASVLIESSDDVNGSETADTSWYKDGQSTFSIGTAGQLRGLADLVNNGNAFSGKTINLTANISLSGTWTPIGNGARDSNAGTSNPHFSGTFDGNGHVISGLSSTEYTTNNLKDSKEYVYGLFGFTINATIKNLTVSGVSIDVDSTTAPFGDSVGALVGHALGTLSVENVNTSGSVEATDAAAGVVGRFYGTALTMTGCTSTVNVTSTYSNSKAGGMTSFTSNSGQTIAITNCVNGTEGGNDGIITAPNAGGIIGYTGGSNKTVVKIEDSTNNGKVSGTNYGGGIIGYDASLKTKSLQIEGCRNTGKVSGSDSGGIIGLLQSPGTITGCTSSGDISGNGAGGIVGSLSGGDSAGTLIARNCRVIGSCEIKGNDIAGGIIGNFSGGGGTIDSCSVSGSVSITTTNTAVKSNGDTLYQGTVRGLAVGIVTCTDLTVKDMEETSKYELVSSIYLNGENTITLENCKTKTLMTWGANSGTTMLVLKNTALAGIEMYRYDLKIDADPQSYIGELQVGANRIATEMSDAGLPPGSLTITIASGKCLTVSKVGMNQNSVFKGESETSKYLLATDTSATTFSWNGSAWTGGTTLTPPNVSISSDNDSPIVGDTVSLNAIISNEASGFTYGYEWSTGDKTKSIDITAQGEYSVTITMTVGPKSYSGTASIDVKFSPKETKTTDDSGTITKEIEYPDGTKETEVTDTTGASRKTTISTAVVDKVEISVTTVVEKDSDGNVVSAETKAEFIADSNGEVSTSAVVAAIDAMKSDDTSDLSKTISIRSETEQIVFEEAAVNAISSSGAVLEFTNEAGTLTADQGVMSTLADQSYSLTLSFSETENDTLSKAQQKVVGDSTAYSLALIRSDGVAIHDLNGTVTVSVEYTPSGSTSLNDIQVIYVDDNGKMEAIDTKYDSGILTFNTDHFSCFMIGTSSMLPSKPVIVPDYDDDDYYPIVPVTPTSTSDGDDDAKTALACAAAAVVAALMAAFLIIDTKRR